MVLLTLGGKYGTCSIASMGEGVDGANINLPPCQDAFIRAAAELGKPLVGIHFDGRPISSDIADQCLNEVQLHYLVSGHLPHVVNIYRYYQLLLRSDFMGGNPEPVILKFRIGQPIPEGIPGRMGQIHIAGKADALGPSETGRSKNGGVYSGFFSNGIPG